jgi:hypothetical protein
MKTSRIVLVIVAVVIIVIIAISVYSALTTTTASPWRRATSYPVEVDGVAGVAAQQCVNSTAYIYCIGGADVNGGPGNEVYTSSAISSSSSNVTSWTIDSNSYPETVYGQSCVASTTYVYCVGGTYDDKGDDVNASYYAPLASDGTVGAWMSTTSFPFPADAQSCVAWSGYMYCVGGFEEALGTNASSFPSPAVYFASISSSGIGSWHVTTSYSSDISIPDCAAADGYIYCVGGVDSNGNAISTDYAAQLSSTGVGTWVQTTPYPIQANGQACVISSGTMYCVGGVGESGSFTNAVYYATVSSGRIGTWTKAANYPDSAFTDCVASSGAIYCIGGADSSSATETAATYYIPLETLTTTTTS